jgi:CubicO group peptidase (beta-lactamase class C family)
MKTLILLLILPFPSIADQTQAQTERNLSSNYVSTSRSGKAINNSAISLDVKEELNDYFTALANDNGMNGNVLIARNGKIIYKKSFGFSDFASKKLNTDKSLFPLASISKTFTAVAVLQLKEQGKFKLDDPMAKYLPDFPYGYITIRHLLSHTSGLPDTDSLFEPLITKQPDKIFSIGDTVPALINYESNKSLLFEPGERWSYSSVGFQLLALLVEKISHEPFAVYMKKHVFLPAGMSETYVQTSLVQTKDKYRTVNYQFNNHYEMKLLQMDTLPDWKTWTYNLTGLDGGNNVVSNVTDMLKYDKALYTGKLLKPTTLEEAFTPTKLNNGENSKAIPGYSTGLGWFVSEDTSLGEIMQHSGANPGVSTIMLRNITKKQCIIILQNVQSPPTSATDAMKILNGVPVKYKRSLAFIYAQDVFQRGSDYALTHFNELRNNAEYSLIETEMDRVGLEFSRAGNMQTQSLEAYRLNTQLFPKSWQAFNNYGNALWRIGRKGEALTMFKKSLYLNPDNENAQKKLQTIN